MKKIIIMLIFMVLILPTILAAQERLTLVQKDPATWDPVEGATAKLRVDSRFGLVNVDDMNCKKNINEEGITNLKCNKIVFNKKIRKQINKVIAFLKDAEPQTSYTLVYYGNSEENDVWPYATCLETKTTDRKGIASFKSDFDVQNFLKDEVLQKFWIVKTSDIDCTAGVMTAWNPTEYLFEERTI